MNFNIMPTQHKNRLLLQQSIDGTNVVLTYIRQRARKNKEKKKIVK